MDKEEQIPSTAEKMLERFDVQLSPDETPLCIYMRHWIVFARRVWWIGVVGVIALVLGRRLFSDPTGETATLRGLLDAIIFIVAVIIVAFLYVDWRNDALILTEERLIHVEKIVLFFQSQRETSLDNVQDIRFSVRGLLPTLLKYGDITIDTAARGTDITFGPTPDPRTVQREIMGRVRAIRTQISTGLMRETVLRYLQQGHDQPPQPPVEAEEEPPIDRQRRFLEVLPNPRIDGDRITWYKHWFFLLERLFWPVLLLGLVITLGFFLPSMEVSGAVWVGWGAVVALALFILAVQYQIWLGDIYVLTKDTIIDINRTPFGLFGEKRRAAPLGRIQNITFEKPGLLANLLNFGNVRIQTAGEEDFTFDRVPRPADVQRRIYRRMETHRVREEQRQYEQIAKALAVYREWTQQQSED